MSGRSAPSESCRYRRRRRLAPFLLWAVAAMATACASEEAATPADHDHPPKDYATEAPALQEYELGGDFSMVDQSGETFRLSDHRGKVILLFFGYTSCPDICPITLSRVARASELLDIENEELLTVFISIDPKRDQPEKIKEYLGYFGINAIGVSGQKDDIDRVIEQYGGDYFVEQSDSAAGPLFAHTGYVYLIDQRGMVRFLFTHADSPEWIAAGIAQLLE